MSEVRHTPTPWILCHHLRSPEHDASCPCGYRGGVWSDDGSYIVFEMGSSPDVDPSGMVQGRTQPQADRPTQLADAAFIVTAVNAYDKHLALIETLTKALEEIRDLQPQEFNAYPADWQEQIDACDDCQRYKGHPVMHGRCSTHWQPVYDRERHDAHEIRALGYRAKSMARDALSAAKEISQ